MRVPVAGGFYPFDKVKLKEQVDSFLVEKERVKAFGAVVPHAGYIFSGRTAGKTYSSIETNAKKFALLGPNHTGYGLPISMSSQDWKNSLGTARNAKFSSEAIPVNEDAHMYEHSLEVQIPFLQERFGNFKIIPIALSRLELDEIEILAKNLVSKDIFYIASSDFTHFGPNYGYLPSRGNEKENLEYVKKMDMKAIDYICKIQPDKFYNFVMENKMTICGFVPITLMLFICKSLGAKEGIIIDYTTSYEVHPASSFVAYAGILIK